MKKSKKSEKKQERATLFDKFTISDYIPEKYQIPAMLGIILLVFLIYFSPIYFGGKTYQSGDIITSKSLSSYIDKDREGYSLWYPYIFCGMPAYALATDFKWFNLLWVGSYYTRTLFTVFFDVDYAKWTFYLLILAFTSFFLIYHLTKNRLISLFGGLSVTFSTGIILFLFIGHVTKLTALCFYPLIFLMLLQLKDKITLTNFTLLIIAVHLSFQGWHVQIIFYTLFAIGIFYLYYIVRHIYNKENDQLKKVFKSLATFSGAFLIALLIQSDNLTQIYEYNPYSTRGSESIVDEVKGEDVKRDETEFYQYATNWSFSPGEIMTFIFPSFYGFGNSTYQGPLSNNQEVEVNTYFGQMPFVDVAMYMGILVLVLAIFGIYSNWKNAYVQYLTILLFISLMISFGRTFPIFYDLMFNYFPFFDKFRVPSMILVLIQINLPVLAAFGLKSILELRTQKNIKLENSIKYLAYGFTGLFVLSLLFNSVVTDFFASRVADHTASIRGSQPQLAQQFTALTDYMADMFLSDVYYSLGFLSAAFWLFVIYLRSKLSADLIIIIITLISLFDLLRINNRGAKLIDDENIESAFNEPSYVTTIKYQGDDEPFRIINLKQDGSLGSFNQNSNFNAYFFLQDFYGYSSIKPRTYQDFIDVVGIMNPTMWKMLNVKYVVTDKPFNLTGLSLTYLDGEDSEYIYLNNDALSRAFLADSVAKEESFSFLQKVKENSFDPERVVFADIGNNEISAPEEGAYATIMEYKDEKIVIDVLATGNNFLFLGDTYFPKGWKAFIDGEETEIFKTNHGFRGVIVNEGKHKVEFIYSPVSFVISKYTAFGLSLLTLIGLVFSLIISRKQEA
jgi:hypothetical protein